MLGLPRLHTEPPTPTRRWDAEQRRCIRGPVRPRRAQQCQGAYLNLMHSRTAGDVFEKQAGRRAWESSRRLSLFFLYVLKMIVRNLLLCRRNVFMAVEKMSARCSGINTNGSLGGVQTLLGHCEIYWKTFYCQSIQSVFQNVLGVIHCSQDVPARASSSQYSRL